MTYFRAFVIPLLLSMLVFVFFFRALPLLVRRLFRDFNGQRGYRSTLLPPWRRKNIDLRGIRRTLGTRDVESAIFALAYRLRGRITLSDVIVETGLGMKEAEEVLNGMVDGLRVRMEVGASGLVVYEFPEIIARFEGQSGSDA
jgi:hypothetical protein